MQVDYKCGLYLVIAIFFIYKSTETFLQPSIRFYIYKKICHHEMRTTTTLSESAIWSVCDNADTKTSTSSSASSSASSSSSSLSATLTTSTSKKQQLQHHSISHATALKPRDDSGTEIAKSMKEVQKEAAWYFLANRWLLNMPGVLLSFFCGQWSDRVGRRLPMLVPCFGAVIACFILSQALLLDNSKDQVSIFIMLLGAGVYGCFGKSTVVTMACNSYVTDLSNNKRRTVLLARLLGMNFIGIFFGYFLVGLTHPYPGLWFVLVLVSISNAVIICLILFCVQESVPQLGEAEEEDEENLISEFTLEKKKKSKQHDKNFDKEEEDVEGMPTSGGGGGGGGGSGTSPNSNSSAGGSRLCRWIPVKEERDKTLMLMLLLNTFMNQLCKAGEQDVLYLFLKNFQWQDRTYGYYLSLYYGSMGFILVLLLPLIERLFSPRDTSLILFGLLMKAVRLLLTVYVPNVPVIFAAAVLGSLAGFISSGLRSMVSKLTPSGQTGKMFALLSAMEALSNLFGPALFTCIYYASVDSSMELVFVIDAIAHLAMMIYFVKVQFTREQL